MTGAQLRDFRPNPYLDSGGVFANGIFTGSAANTQTTGTWSGNVLIPGTAAGGTVFVGRGFTGPTRVTGDPNFGTLEQIIAPQVPGDPGTGTGIGGFPVQPPGVMTPPEPFNITPPVIDPPWIRDPYHGGPPTDPITNIGSAYVLPIAPSFTVTAVQSVADTAGAAPAGSGAVDTGLLGALLGAIGGGSSLGSASDPGSGVATSSPIASLPSQPIPPAAPAQSARSAGLSPVLIVGLVVIAAVAFWYFAIRKQKNPHAIGPAA